MLVTKFENGPITYSEKITGLSTPSYYGRTKERRRGHGAFVRHLDGGRPGNRYTYFGADTVSLPICEIRLVDGGAE